MINYLIIFRLNLEKPYLINENTMLTREPLFPAEWPPPTESISWRNPVWITLTVIQSTLSYWIRIAIVKYFSKFFPGLSHFILQTLIQDCILLFKGIRTKHCSTKQLGGHKNFYSIWCRIDFWLFNFHSILTRFEWVAQS